MWLCASGQEQIFTLWALGSPLMPASLVDRWQSFAAAFAPQKSHDPSIRWNGIELPESLPAHHNGGLPGLQGSIPVCLGAVPSTPARLLLTRLMSSSPNPLAIHRKHCVVHTCSVMHISGNLYGTNARELAQNSDKLDKCRRTRETFRSLIGGLHATAKHYLTDPSAEARNSNSGVATATILVGEHKDWRPFLRVGSFA